MKYIFLTSKYQGKTKIHLNVDQTWSTLRPFYMIGYTLEKGKMFERNALEVSFQTPYLFHVFFILSELN
jgi:hypothetical protein